MNPAAPLLKILRIFKLFKILPILTLLIVLMLLPPPFASAYYDIHPNSFLETYLEYLSEKSIISGYPDGTFKPNQSINRAEALKIIFSTTSPESLDSPEDPEAPFDDVPNDQWFSPFIRSAKTLNIVSGYPDGSFKPGQKVNRAEFIKMAMKALPFYEKINGSKTTTLSQYQDLDAKQWYMESVSKAQLLDFLPQTSTLQLHQPMLRGDAAEMIYKVAQYLAKHQSTISNQQSSFIPPESLIVIDALNIDTSPAIPKPAITYEDNIYETVAGAQVQVTEKDGLLRSEWQSGQLSLSFDNGCFVDFLRYPYEGNPQIFYEENLMIDEYSMFSVKDQSFLKMKTEQGYDYYEHSVSWDISEKGLEELEMEATDVSPYFLLDNGYALTIYGHGPGKEENECKDLVETVKNNFSLVPKH